MNSILRKVLSFATAVSATFCLVSCLNMGDSSIVPQIEIMTIKGAAYDFDTKQALSDITVVLNAYDDTDIRRENTPVYTDSVRTSQTGLYNFLCVDCPPTRIFEVKAVDISPLRTVHYKTAGIELYIDASSPLYNSSSKSFSLSNNNFYLSR